MPEIEMLGVQVTLVVPWLALSDQATVFDGKCKFSQPNEQEECIRDWVHRRVGFRPTFGVIFYMGRYDRRLLGIFPVGDVTSYIPAHQARLLPRPDRAWLLRSLTAEQQLVAVPPMIPKIVSSMASNRLSGASIRCLRARLVAAKNDSQGLHVVCLRHACCVPQPC